MGNQMACPDLGLITVFSDIHIFVRIRMLLLNNTMYLKAKICKISNTKKCVSENDNEKIETIFYPEINWIKIQLTRLVPGITGGGGGSLLR